MNKFKKILIFIYDNKIFVIIALFIVFMLFLDNNNLIKKIKRGREIDKLKQEQVELQKCISELEKRDVELSSGRKDALETYAREKLMMSEENEVTYIVDTTTIVFDK